MKEKLIYRPKKSLDIALNAVVNGILTFLAIALILACVFFGTHVYYNVKGTSMEPNIHQATSVYAGDACYVAKGVGYGYGDIIVAEKDDTKDVVKRVIAMGGDKVGFYYNSESGFYEVLLVIPGAEPKILEESYLFERVSAAEAQVMRANNATTYSKFIQLQGLEELEFEGQIVNVLSVPKNHLFLLGDNRATSIDSASYGTIHESKVVGRVVIVTKQGTLPVWEILSQAVNRLLFQ